MKRFAGIVMTAILLTILCVMPVSAAGFELTDSNPEQGYDKVQVTNVMIKLFFSEDVSDEATQTANEGKISVRDSSGKDIGFSVIYDSKDASKISLLMDDDLQEEEEYTVQIDGSLISDTEMLWERMRSCPFPPGRAARRRLSAADVSHDHRHDGRDIPRSEKKDDGRRHRSAGRHQYQPL